jgi:hypothetical protein
MTGPAGRAGGRTPRITSSKCTFHIWGLFVPPSTRLIVKELVLPHIRSTSRLISSNHIFSDALYDFKVHACTQQQQTSESSLSSTSFALSTMCNDDINGCSSTIVAPLTTSKPRGGGKVERVTDSFLFAGKGQKRIMVRCNS